MPANRKLGKTTDQRMAMLRQQVTDLLDKGRMETTVTRAKEICPLAEKMITLGKQGGLANYRQAMAFFTRIIRIGPRRGDAAEMAIIELV